MRIICFLFFILIFCVEGAPVCAQVPFMRGGTAVLSPEAIGVARAVFSQRRLLTQVSRGIIQISRPGSPEVLGTGFVFRARKRLWVAMPYHIGGVAGTRRMIRFAGADNLPQEREITIAVNGNAGWHAPDVSLAEFPPQDAAFVQPLSLAAPRLNEVAYSFGYVSGRICGLDELLPVRRSVFNAEGFGLISNRIIAGEDPKNPFNISGYCGAPVMQRVGGEWRAVGLHTGSCVTESGLTRGFAVNVTRIVPLLLNRYLGKGSGFSRELAFRGWILDKLLPSERIYSIEVLRGGERVFMRFLRNFPSPYSDEHSELALADFELAPQDRIRYEIRNNQRETRYVSHILP